MRFELAIALKYLLPRARRLSASLISLLSVLVISLVVWLIVVFLSVTDGIEKKWQEQMVALSAPLRITPTEEYYHSYYYLIDSHSASSDYAFKSVGEKLKSPSADPYDPRLDAELPPSFPSADKHSDGSLKDIVKETWGAIDGLSSRFPGLTVSEFETALAHLEIALHTEGSDHFFTQVSYLSSCAGCDKRLKKLLDPSPWVTTSHEGKTVIESHPQWGEGVVLPRSLQKTGVRVGDRGSVAYFVPGGTKVREQKIPVYVAGFYDSGLMPFGSKLLFASPTLLTALRGELLFADEMLGNGIGVDLPTLSDALRVKEALSQAIEAKGLTQYLRVETFLDFSFTKPLFEQLKSDRTLFTLIALIILLVACSNIISMLILLVNDKKKEIGILQSLGASKHSIALIFGLCGCITGVLSSLIGASLALLTLHNLDSLVRFLSFLQGREAFQAMFYGDKLPADLSVDALLFALGATILLSLLAGIVPAWKAARITPAETLRAD